jgi:hypothetical protein
MISSLAALARSQNHATFVIVGHPTLPLAFSLINDRNSNGDNGADR